MVIGPKTGAGKAVVVTPVDNEAGGPPKLDCPDPDIPPGNDVALTAPNRFPAKLGVVVIPVVDVVGPPNMGVVV